MDFGNAMWPLASSRLNDDILYQIFMFSTYRTTWQDRGYEDLPLTTIRACSQVCVQWRRLLLRAKRIWGCCINIDGLRKDEWIEEVLERAGDSLLTVRCGDGAARLLGDEYVATLLGRLWPMIRHLEIGPEATYSARILEILERPTETMECFTATSDIFFPRYDRTETPSVSLFSGYAPNLSFIYLGKGVSKFKPKPIWESPSFFTNNIREICLTNESLATDSATLLSACKRMPLLESLLFGICYEANPEDMVTDTQEVIPMSHLSSLDTVSTQFAIYPAFLSRISTAPGCRLYMEHFVIDKDYSDSHMVAMKQVYTTFSNSMFMTPRTEVSDKAKISLGSRLLFQAYDNAICIEARFPNALRAREYYPSLIDTFLAVKMPSASIDLSLDMKSYTSEKSKGWVGPMMAQEDLPEVQYSIRILLGSMLYVTTPRMTYSDFVLIASPAGKLHTPNCFPRLRHLHLRDSGDVDYGGVLLPFVLGSPLVTVNLSQLPWSPVDELVAYGLNRFHPCLEFIWNNTHYFSVAKGVGRLPIVRK